MDLENIVFTKSEHVATITINRPQKLNALSPGVFADLETALQDVANDDDVRVVVITGAGRAFSAGGEFDYSEIRKGRRPELGPERMVRYLGRGRVRKHSPYINIMLELQRLEKVTIAMVNGDAVGAGFDLALGCDLRVGSEKARFSVGYTRISALPVLGGAWFLPRLIGLSKAMEFLLLSDFCGAEEASRLGILNKLVPHEDLESETKDLAGKLVKLPPVSQRLVKLLTYRSLELDLETSLLFTVSANFMAEGSQDNVEAIVALAEKRAPVFKDK